MALGHRVLMTLIIKSFLLSFGVFGRMIFPALVVVVVLSLTGGILSSFTGGHSEMLFKPISATFLSLFGIRMALSLIEGQRRVDYGRVDYGLLFVYAVLYGLFFFVVKGVALTLIDAIALLSAEKGVDGAVTFRNFVDAEAALKAEFAFYAFSVKAILSLVIFTSIPVVMAVPLAGAARSAGARAPESRFFNGVGQSFVPLFCIFAVSFSLQFFFELFSTVLGVFPLIVAVIAFVFSQSIPEPDQILAMFTGVLALAGLLWLHSWIWAASAVALLQTDDAPKPPRKRDPDEDAPAVDIRALRKSRQSGK